MQAIPFIIMAVGTVLQTVSGVTQSREAAKQAKEEAKSIQTQTDIAQRQERQKNAYLLGEQRAMASASGLEGGSGSPLTTLLDSAFNAEMNALNIGYTGAVRKYSKLWEVRQAKQAGNAALFKGITGLGSIMGSMYGGGASSAASSGGGLMSGGTTGGGGSPYTGRIGGGGFGQLSSSRFSLR